MGIEYATAWLMLAALGLYTLLGGADFGAGVWDLLATGPRKRQQRERLAHAIGPIWEANHVWVIAVVVLLFTCFPRAFAAIMTALHVPVTLVLLGIVARGTSFVFRTYSPGDDRTQNRWGMVFSIASVATPILLGVTLGTLATGTLRWQDGVYVSGFFAPWLAPFPWAVGVFALSIFAFLAAVYMCAELRTAEAPLRDDFRRRALLAAIAVGMSAALCWVLASRGAPELSRGLSGAWWTWPLQIATGLAASGAIWSLWTRRYFAARALAVVQVSLIVLGYGAALFPYLVVPDVRIDDSAAPPRTHALVLAAFGAGAIILIPSLFILYRVFKGERAFRLVDRAGTGGDAAQS